MSRLRPRGTGPWLLVASLLLAVLVSPFAIAAGEGDPIEGGVRNPSNNESQSLTRETEIIANTSTYGTRQSNKSDNGGGAIYGCRSKAGGSGAGNEPCIRSNNLADGLAFEFETDGAAAGRIQVKDPNAKPFTTNATGVADGLNADRVDGKNATDIAGDAVTAVQSGIRFAAISSDGATTGRGVTAGNGRDSEGLYRVTFAADADKCVFQATQVLNTDAEFDNAGAVAVRLLDDKRTLRVVTRDADGTLADRDVHVQATCL